MAKLGKSAQNEQEGKETVEFFKDLDREALNTERFVEKYSKPLGLIFGALLLGVLGFFAYKQFVIAPKNAEAVKSFLAAQKNLQKVKIKML